MLWPADFITSSGRFTLSGSSCFAPAVTGDYPTEEPFGPGSCALNRRTICVDKDVVTELSVSPSEMRTEVVSAQCSDASPSLNSIDVDIELHLQSIPAQCRDFARHLWSAIPADGAPISNHSLRRQTRTVMNDGYRPARNALRDVGLIAFGKGQSGTVMRSEPFVVCGLAHVSRPRRGLEVSLYPQIETEIRNRLEDAGFHNSIVKTTASGGARSSGGRWRHPDLIAVAHRGFNVLPGGYLEVHTYEVKTGAALDLTSLHEALAHRRRAHQSYVLVDCEESKDREHVEHLIADARDLGVGLMSYFAVEDDWDVWYEPPLTHPDPSELDEFLFLNLSVTEREKLREWSAVPGAR